LLLLAGITGCTGLDVSEPIVLLPDGFTSSERTMLESAAQCWNMEFGTRIQVSTGDGRASQHVKVAYSELLCVFAYGRTEPHLPVSIHLCPHVRGSSRSLFDVALHELGHVLNIRGHADDPLAVMYQSDGDGIPPDSRPYHLFAQEDRQLFREANEGVGLPRGCRVTVTQELFHPIRCRCT
jgi:hypothetical protein